MNKKVFTLTALALFSVLLLMSVASAYTSNYGYGNDDGYKRTSYTKTVVKDSPYGPSYSKTTDYNKETNKIYLGGGGYEKVTSYTKRVTKSPDYRSGYGYGGYGGYGSRYGDDYYEGYIGSYYPKSAYTYDYKPYYQQGRYWRTEPSYTYRNYGSGNQYGYDYYYRPTFTNGNYNWRY